MPRAGGRRGQGHLQCLGVENTAFRRGRRTLRPGLPFAGALPVEPTAGYIAARIALDKSHGPVCSERRSKDLLQRCLESDPKVAQRPSKDRVTRGRRV